MNRKDNEVTCLQKIMKRMAAACLALSLYTTSPVLAALPPMLSAEQVFPGMHGTAYTVVDGTGEIKTFDVDIIGTIDQGKGCSGATGTMLVRQRRRKPA